MILVTKKNHISTILSYIIKIRVRLKESIYFQLPVGDECDWVSSAKAAGSSTDLSSKQNESSFPQATIVSKESKPEDFTNGATATTRRQSMRLPVKNIRFDRAANENNTVTSGAPRTGRRATIAVGVEDLHASRRSTLSPPTPLPSSSGRSAHVEPRSATRPLTGNKSPTPRASVDKTCKKTVT